MVVRLASAVATAWVPDIFILDEVLTIGAEPFPRKYLERLRLFRESWATILLVSHNTAQVCDPCSRASWLEPGERNALGPTAEVAAADEALTGGGVPQ